MRKEFAQMVLTGTKKWAPNLIGVPIFYSAHPPGGQSVRVTG
jgi:hypothetical protein